MAAKVDLNRVTTFVQVVEAGSFTAAARQLRLPISSVSRAVARVEEELGVRLLHRTTRKLALTEAGRRYFQRMQAVVTEAQSAADDAAGESRQATGTVRITAPPDAGLLRLAPLVSEIVRNHPGLHIDLTLTMRPLDLIDEGIDLAIRGGRLEDSTLVAHRIGPNDFGVVAAPAYLATHGTPRTPRDLETHDCIRLRSRDGLLPWRLQGPGGTRDLPVAGALICDDMGFAHQATLAGAGLGFLPIQVLGEDLRAGRLVRVLPRHLMRGGSLFIVWPSQRLLPARVALVRDLLLAGLRQVLSG